MSDKFPIHTDKIDYSSPKLYNYNDTYGKVESNPKVDYEIHGTCKPTKIDKEEQFGIHCLMISKPNETLK